MLVLASFAPLAERGRALIYRDLVVYTAPQDAFLKVSINVTQTLPRTNPWIYGGVPHLADPSTQTLYPPRLLCAALGPPRSIHVFVVLHVLVAALGAALLARSLGASRPAAAAGGAVYALSGPVLSLVENLPLLAGAAWLPLACALARRRSVFAAIPLALIALAGDVQGATWGALLVLFVLVARRQPGGGRPIAKAILVPAAGLLLAGVLLVPALQLRDQTDRPDMTAESAGAWSLAPSRLVELAAPFPFGVSYPERRSVTHALEPAGSKVTEPWAETIHVGVVGLVLGVGALADRRRRRGAAVLLVLGGLALLAAMGPRGPGVWQLLRLLPFYGEYRHPEKHAVLFALAAAPLAALGVDAARRNAPLVAFPIVGLALGSTILRLAALVAVAHRPVTAGQLTQGLLYGQLPHALLALAVAATIAALRSPKKRLLLALLVALDVAVATHPRLFVGDASLYDEHPLGVELARRSSGRVLRLPWVGGAPIGRIPSPEEMPGRNREERAIAARVHSWVGSVSARERVLAAHGMASFVPKKMATLDLDAWRVRYLVTDGRGDGVAVASSYGVTLLDRGERIEALAVTQPDPPVVVPSLVPGLLVSILGAALLFAGRLRLG